MARRLELHKPHIRYYLSDGTRAVGASTIAGINKPVDPLMGWAANLARQGKDWRKERDKTADYGHIAHFLIECHLTNEEPDLSEFTDEEIHTGQIAYEKFLKFWEENKIEIIASERAMISDEFRFGGTLDLLGLMGEELILFDWKTSKKIYPGHIIQAVGYKKLFEHGKVCDNKSLIAPAKISRVSIVRVGRDAKSDFEQYWVPPEMIEKYWACFRARLDVYNADKAIQ